MFLGELHNSNNKTKKGRKKRKEGMRKKEITSKGIRVGTRSI